MDPVDNFSVASTIFVCGAKTRTKTVTKSTMRQVCENPLNKCVQPWYPFTALLRKNGFFPLIRGGSIDDLLFFCALGGCSIWVLPGKIDRNEVKFITI